MHHGLKETIEGLDGIVGAALYELPGKTVPVIVLEEEELPSRKQLPHGVDGWIILTQEDIKRGSDVFALTFLHIQHRSTHLKGENFFTDMIIPTDVLRTSLETTIRHLLIDIREWFVLGTHLTPQQITGLKTMFDRIWLGTSVLIGKYPYELSMIREALHEVDAVLHTSQITTYEALFEHKDGNFHDLYEDLLVLAKKIDTFEA